MINKQRYHTEKLDLVYSPLYIILIIKSFHVMDMGLKNLMSTDLLFNIFSNFRLEQKVKAAQVCQVWKDVVYHRSLWRNIKIKIERDIEEHSVDTILPHLVKRNITNVKCVIYSEEDAIIANKLMKDMASLRSIDLYIRTRQYPQLFLNDLPNSLKDHSIKPHSYSNASMAESPPF